ncbi:hypothetical protein N2152v2_007623 [Parachlorella kessleri]
MAFTEEELRLAEPDRPEDVKVEAWYMDDTDADQRLPHRQTPNKPCSLDALGALGVLAYRLTQPDSPESDPRLAAIKKVRGYTYEDLISIHPDTLPNYEEKIKSFYQEHLHTDEEIRYIVDGSGYFDVRDNEDRWIRIWTRKGDLIIVPAGIYHRFTLDTSNYIKVVNCMWRQLGADSGLEAARLAMRLFVGEPVWTPHNRDAAAESIPARKQYVETLGTAIKAH